MDKKAKYEDVPVEKLQLGMMKGPGGDYFEHDLAELAPLIEKKRQQEHPGCRVCFDYEYSRLQTDGICLQTVIVEEVAGYEPTTFDIDSTDETARWNVERANAALALTKDNITEIIRSTMD